MCGEDDPEAFSQIPEWEGRSSVAVLFGRYVAELRMDAKVPHDALAGAMDRTQGWLRSLERGEFFLTEPMIRDLEAAFNEVLTPAPDHALVDSYIELLDNPHGFLAEALAKRIPPERLVEEETPSIARPDGLLPIAESLSFEDRLLTLFPAAILLVVGALALFALAPIKGWDSIEPDFSIVLLAGSGLAAALAVVVGTLSSLMDKVSGVLIDLLGLRKKRKDIVRWARENNLSLASDSRWFQPEFKKHLMPAYRSDASDVGLGAEFAFRVSVAFVIASGVTGAAALYGGATPFNIMLSTTLADYSPSSYLAGIFLSCVIFTASSLFAARDRSLRAHGTIRDGLGLIRDLEVDLTDVEAELEEDTASDLDLNEAEAELEEDTANETSSE